MTSSDDLRQQIQEILKKYPMFLDIPIGDGHAHCCTRWEITADHGSIMGNAWNDYASLIWSLGLNEARQAIPVQ